MSVPIRVALFSGGHDSLCATHYAMAHGLADEVAHVNTGIGIEETRQFVRSTCAAQGWPLVELHPPVSFEAIVLRGGLPGPAQHFTVPGRWVGIYTQLKERALAAHARERKPRRGHPFVYVTGARKQESTRRMGTVTGEWQPDPKRGWSWHAPLYAFTKVDCSRYMEDHDLARNPVVDLLHMSGECLCGCFARAGEREDLRCWFPAVEAQIAALEVAAREAGHAACEWGKRPPELVPGQMQLGDGMLCLNCAAAPVGPDL